MCSKNGVSFITYQGHDTIVPPMTAYACQQLSV